MKNNDDSDIDILDINNKILLNFREEESSLLEFKRRLKDIKTSLELKNIRPRVIETLNNTVKELEKHIHDIENKHTWGVDILLGHFNIRAAIYYKFMVTHTLPSTTHGGVAGEEMQNYLAKHGFVDVFDVHRQYEPIRYIIEVTDDKLMNA